MISAIESSSTRPYLIRALYEWCTDNGFTPYIAVQVDDGVQVPREYVKNGEIVLNISFDATSSLKLGNDFIEFKARFAGTARENGQGMAFPPPAAGSSIAGATAPVPATTAAATTGGKAAAASRNGAEADPARIVHLVTGDAEATAPVSSAGAGSDEEPPKPPAGGGARPSLKRIK